VYISITLPIFGIVVVLDCDEVLTGEEVSLDPSPEFFEVGEA
jgi:hypothetical protein